MQFETLALRVLKAGLTSCFVKQLDIYIVFLKVEQLSLFAILSHSTFDALSYVFLISILCNLIRTSHTNVRIRQPILPKSSSISKEIGRHCWKNISGFYLLFCFYFPYFKSISCPLFLYILLSPFFNKFFSPLKKFFSSINVSSH